MARCCWFSTLCFQLLKEIRLWNLAYSSVWADFGSKRRSAPYASVRLAGASNFISKRLSRHFVSSLNNQGPSILSWPAMLIVEARRHSFLLILCLVTWFQDRLMRRLEWYSISHVAGRHQNNENLARKAGNQAECLIAVMQPLVSWHGNK